uniref:Uncharacterized protein n=1 Tax=Globodera rostochiensis TaxID=31243 RepID=A0A914H739_GLORO
MLSIFSKPPWEFNGWIRMVGVPEAVWAKQGAKEAKKQQFKMGGNDFPQRAQHLTPSMKLVRQLFYGQKLHLNTLHPPPSTFSGFGRRAVRETDEKSGGPFGWKMWGGNQIGEYKEAADLWSSGQDAHYWP